MDFEELTRTERRTLKAYIEGAIALFDYSLKKLDEIENPTDYWKGYKSAMEETRRIFSSDRDALNELEEV